MAAVNTVGRSHHGCCEHSRAVASTSRLLIAVVTIELQRSRQCCSGGARWLAGLMASNKGSTARPQQPQVGGLPGNAAYFGGYELSRALVPAGSGAVGDMAVGAGAQLIAGVVFTPVDIIKERMQVRRHREGGEARIENNPVVWSACPIVIRQLPTRLLPCRSVLAPMLAPDRQHHPLYCPSLRLTPELSTSAAPVQSWVP
eukprot:352223-Chlamydomonas_euryale.AAC.13